MRLSRTRSIALATAAAVTAAGVVAPSALAQEETAPDAETAAVSESAAPENESETETPAADESESESESETPAPGETDTEEEPAGETTPAQINLTVEAKSDKSTVTRVLEDEPEVAKALENHPSVSWSIKDGSLPVGMKFSTVSSTLTIQPGQLRDKSSQTFVATDLATGEVVAEVTVTVTGVADTPINPGNKVTPTTPRQVAIIVGVAAAIAATLAGMVQFLVPGGWQHVISYFSGQR